MAPINSQQNVYYEDYIRERAEQAFDYDDAQFSLFDSDHEEIAIDLERDLMERLFEGAMREMVKYLFERRNELGRDTSIDVLVNEDNIENIYISETPFTAPTIVVEFEEVPEWFEMENAALREFQWYPNPALSGEWTAGYFQPRRA